MFIPIYQIVTSILSVIAIFFCYIGVVKMRDETWWPIVISTSAAIVNLTIFVLVITNMVAPVIDIVIALINIIVLMIICSAATYVDGFDAAKKIYQTEKLKNDLLVSEDGELNLDIHNEALPKTSLEELR